MMQNKMSTHYCLLDLATGDINKRGLCEEAINQNGMSARLSQEASSVSSEFHNLWMCPDPLCGMRKIPKFLNYFLFSINWIKE